MILRWNEHLVGQQEVLRNLLRDGRGALRTPARTEVLGIEHAGTRNAGEIDAAVLAEILILCRMKALMTSFGTAWIGSRAVARAHIRRQRRLYIPIQAVPKLVINAFISAEDKNFYEHGGLDFGGIVRAGMLYAQNYGSSRRPQGASTITQQVAKNFLLTNEVSFQRKIKEALLALKIERTYSKEKIFELYLNEIYLGFSAYGVAAASLLYFDKSVHELTVAEAAYLAALPKAPTLLHPFRQRERAIERRNYVIDRMVENGYVTAADGENAKKSLLSVTQRPTGAHVFAAEYFAEEVRREIYDKYGEKKLYEGGLSVRTTLDPKTQVIARKALIDGVVNYDEQQGYRGPVAKIDIAGDWGLKLADVRALNDISPWRLAVVLEVNDQGARIGFQPAREPGGAVLRERKTGNIALDGVKWAKPAGGPDRFKPVTRVSSVLKLGDVVYVDPLGTDTGQFRLRQLPEVSGAMVVMDPLTGRVLAGGGRVFLRSKPVRSRNAGNASARLVVQAICLRGCARQRVHAVYRRAGRPA